MSIIMSDRLSGYEHFTVANYTRNSRPYVQDAVRRRMSGAIVSRAQWVFMRPLGLKFLYGYPCEGTPYLDYLEIIAPNLSII